MPDFIQALAIYLANGFLAPTYVFWEHLAGILVLASFSFFTARAPAGHRAWTVGAGTLALLAAFLAPTPAPFLLAALAHLGYQAYLAGVDAAAWAQAIGGQGEASAALAQGRAFVETLATWGLWLILPLGYFSLLAQVLLAHPPLSAKPDEIITAVRTREGK